MGNQDNEQETQTHRCRVRFQEEKTYIESDIRRTQFDDDESWWSSEDYDTFKLQAQMIARESRQSSCSNILDNTFGNTRATSRQRTQRVLEQWTTRLVSRRGLEMWCCRRHGSERKRSQQQAIKAVIHDQEVQRKHFGRVNSDQLARVSQLLSKNARIFANQMGLADQRSLTAPAPGRSRLDASMMRMMEKASSTATQQEMVSLDSNTSKGVAIAA